MSAPAFDWLHAPPVQAVVACLGAASVRFVGGAVRDSLLGRPVTDVDIATLLAPQAVMDRAAAAGIRAVPTGVEHGTVTLVADHRPFEVTTLRRDVSTDGRRAVVAYTDSWQEDAARRDFTINALYCESSGALHDYFGGLDDLKAGRVRFIGDPLARIREDALRILRFFRFSAHFARGTPDPAGLAACAARANDLKSLSRERVRMELVKLLQAPDPAAVVDVMIETGVLAAVLPEATTTKILRRVMALEQMAQSPDALRRLVALLPDDSADVDLVAARLRFSTADRRRMVAARQAPCGADKQTMKKIIYRYGRDAAQDALYLRAPDGPALMSLLRFANEWSIPRFPFNGRQLMAAGLPEGPHVGKALADLESAWIDAGFPEDETALAGLLRASAERTPRSL